MHKILFFATKYVNPRAVFNIQICTHIHVHSNMLNYEIHLWTPTTL